MDPDECLKELLALADRILQDGQDDPDTAAEELADKLYGLDQWLTKGGFLPKRWTTANGSIFDRMDTILELVTLTLNTTLSEPGYVAVLHIIESVLRAKRLKEVNFHARTAEGLKQLRRAFTNNYRFWKYVKVTDI